MHIGIQFTVRCVTILTICLMGIGRHASRTSHIRVKGCFTTVTGGIVCAITVGCSRLLGMVAQEQFTFCVLFYLITVHCGSKLTCIKSNVLAGDCKYAVCNLSRVNFHSPYFTVGRLGVQCDLTAQVKFASFAAYGRCS